MLRPASRGELSEEVFLINSLPAALDKRHGLCDVRAWLEPCSERRKVGMMERLSLLAQICSPRQGGGSVTDVSRHTLSQCTGTSLDGSHPAPTRSFSESSSMSAPFEVLVLLFVQSCHLFCLLRPGASGGMWIGHRSAWYPNGVGNFAHEVAFLVLGGQTGSELQALQYVAPEQACFLNSECLMSSSCTGACTAEMSMAVVMKVINDSGRLATDCSWRSVMCHVPGLFDFKQHANYRLAQ